MARRPTGSTIIMANGSFSRIAEGTIAKEAAIRLPRFGAITITTVISISSSPVSLATMSSNS